MRMIRQLLAGGLAVILTTVSGGAENLLERGAYLVKAVAACGICHSPVDQSGDQSGPDLSGGPATLSSAFVAYPPNLTADLTTGLGAWSEDQIASALRDGKTPDGHVLRPPMPVPFYRSMSDNDVRAIATYLKSLPATERRVPESTYKVPTPSTYGPPIAHVADIPQDDRVTYGAYLAKLAHCMQCHTPIGKDGRRDYTNSMGAGGLSVDFAWGSRRSANITPDLATGIGGWSDEQIITAISHGIRNDGGLLSPIMPWRYFAGMRHEDLTAIVSWLRTLKPVANAVER
jgi:mono/diheme cytochrome c family protein